MDPSILYYILFHSHYEDLKLHYVVSFFYWQHHWTSQKTSTNFGVLNFKITLPEGKPGDKYPSTFRLSQFRFRTRLLSFLLISSFFLLFSLSFFTQRVGFVSVKRLAAVPLPFIHVYSSYYGKRNDLVLSLHSGLLETNFVSYILCSIFSN